MSETAGVRMVVVVEAPWPGEWTAPWPVAAFAPGELIVLDGAASPETVGAVVAHLARYNHHRAPEGTSIDGSGAEVLRAIMEMDRPLLPGGVRVRDGAGNAVEPGCCCGVEGWRQWLAVTDGETSPWMGHDPWGWVEHEADALRVRCRPESGEPGDDATTTIIVPRADLPRLLAGIEADLRAFLPRLHEWAVAIDPAYGARLAERFEAAFVVP
jgi:hypothetical protein